MFLLKPSKLLNDRILGIIGRAQRFTRLGIHGIDFQFNHHHMLLSVSDAYQLADFMKRVQGQISTEIRLQRGWLGTIWESRYKPEILADDETDLVRRFRYILAQGCKSGLVASPLEWPGVSSAKALCRGRFELTGTWVDHAGISRRRSKEPIDVEAFSSVEKVHLTKLPGLDALTDSAYSEWVRSQVEDVEIETRKRHEANSTRPLGVTQLMRTDPKTVPDAVAWGPRPRVIASDSEKFDELWQALRQVSTAHGDASARLSAGETDVVFPEGTFPSRGPFVSSSNDTCPDDDSESNS